MASHDGEGSHDGTGYSADRSVDSKTYATMDELTRRRLLELGAASSLTSVVAGCANQDDSPGATTDVEVDTTTEPTDDDMTETATEAGETAVVEEGTETTVQTVVSWNWPLDETTLNRFRAANFPGGATGSFFFVPMVMYSKQDQQFYPLLMKELPTYDRCFQLYILKENFTFWDGKEHNAYDRVYGHQINSYNCCGGPDQVPWNAEIYEQYETPRFAFKENKGSAYAPAIAASNAGSAVHWRRDIFKPIFDKVQDAETDDEIQQAINEVKNIDLLVGDADEHNAGTSMWKPVDAAADKLTMEVYEDHPFADNTNLDRWVIQNATKLQSELQLINNDDVDVGSTNFDDLQNPPESLNVQGEFIGNLGKGMAFNWRRKVPGDRAFRRAVTYLLPLEDIAAAARQSGKSTQAVDQQTTAAPRDIVKQGTNDGFLDSIIDYGVDSRPEEATRVLEDAGYSSQNDNWVDPDGQQIDLRLVARTASVNTNIGSAIAGTMSNFGITTDFSVLETGTYDKVVNPDAGNFDYDIHITGMNISRGNAEIISGANNAAEITPNDGWSTSGVEECESATKNPKEPNPEVLGGQEDGSGFLTYQYGIPITEDGLFPPIPEEIGQTDLSGDTYRPDISRRAYWSSFRFDSDTIKNWNTEHLWWANFYMPKIYFYTNRVAIWMDQEDFELTDDAALDTMGDAGKFWQATPDKHPFVYGEMDGR